MRSVRLLCVTPRRLVLALCLFGFIWVVMFMNLSLIGGPDDVASPDELRVSKHQVLLVDAVLQTLVILLTVQLFVYKLK